MRLHQVRVEVWVLEQVVVQVLELMVARVLVFRQVELVNRVRLTWCTSHVFFPLLNPYATDCPNCPGRLRPVR